MREDLKSRRPWLVSFSGIDGAGKSTQIAAFRQRMQEAGLQVALITFWDDVAQLTSLREAGGHALFKGDKGVGRPEAPINRRDKNVQSRSMTALRFFLYFLDALSLRSVAQKAKRRGVDLVIFDRYAYDELANLKLSNPAVRAYARFIMKIVPQPHIAYLLDADPAAARARKPEYPLDFLYACREAYLALSKLVGGITVVAPGRVDEVEREVLNHALEMLRFENLSSASIMDRADGSDAAAAPLSHQR